MESEKLVSREEWLAARTSLLAEETYGRGIDVFNGAYQILDLTPKGRDEGDAFDPMFWLRRHDQYHQENAE